MYKNGSLKKLCNNISKYKVFINLAWVSHVAICLYGFKISELSQVSIAIKVDRSVIHICTSFK